ncbi:2971_t:CDS:2 [Entrophospora sp. SA101]|nr:2971_t:CDS:2 [Entrophospora sp. SA101]
MSDAYPEYVEEFSIEISDFDPISPTCHIPLPDTMPKCNNGVINIKTMMNGALDVHPERNPNMEGIPIPVPVSTPVYQKFEENNPKISLCVYKWSNENKCLEFNYISERRSSEFKEVNLLVISESDEIENPRSHYCIIKDLHRLVYNHRPDALEKFVDKLEIELAEIQTDLSTPAEMKDFPNQKKVKIMVCCPNTRNYVGASHRECKNKNEIIGPKWYQQPSIGDNVAFKEAKECMYCKEKDMLDIGLTKVRDHCHISGKYRGPAHSNCNKKLQMGPFKTKVPLICHNFRGYDSHLLIEVVGRFTSNKLKCIPENIGKYKAMDVGQLRFLDSIQNMNMGLDKLVASMSSNLEKFPLTIKHFTDKGCSLDQIKFLFRKGVFPYDWTKSWDKFKKTALPRRKDFYSLLSQQNISNADYVYAQEVWQKFEMKTFGKYHDLYLETDVLLLADIFMNYTIMCLKDDGLDPSHYVSAPSMFNDSLYKSSRAEIKLLTDLDQYMLVERGIRGGMSMVSQRYAKANNPQCPDYDESKPNSWPPEEIPNILEIPNDAEEGYLLEVDMEVLLNLHDLFNDNPLAPEKGVVPKNWLSPYNEDLVND